MKWDQKNNTKNQQNKELVLWEDIQDWQAIPIPKERKRRQD
jgi:hypothetical protein